jgi:hypothetical protein
MPADHHEGVTEPVEPGPEPVDGAVARVVGVKQVHHLVGRTVLGEVVGRERHRDRVGAKVGPGERVLAGERSLRRVEHHAQPTASGVDHAGVP